MLSFSGTMARFSGRAGDELYTALRDALVERRMPLSFLATDAEEVSLDPHYVRCVSRSFCGCCCARRARVGYAVLYLPALFRFRAYLWPCFFRWHTAPNAVPTSAAQGGPKILYYEVCM